MKKVIPLILFIVALLSSCDGNKKDIKNTNGGLGEDKWKDIKYTKEELDEKYSYGSMPFGIHFFDEFPSLKSLYNLSAEESAMLGRWETFDTQIDANNYYYFYPNKLFMICFMLRNYAFVSEENIFLRRGVGVWSIRDNKVFAQIFFFLTHRLTTDDIKKGSLVRIEPYEIELIDFKDIDADVGYSKRPFRKFELPAELKKKIKVSPIVNHEHLLARQIYYIGELTLTKDYYYLKTAPDMAKERVSGLDIVQSPELIEKYIWSLWP